MLLGLLLLSMVGVFTRFRRRTILYIHMLSATGGILLLLISFWIYWGLWILPLLMIIGSYIIWKKTKKYIWWIECYAFILCITGFLLTL
jgi:hypothetical protein